MYQGSRATALQDLNEAFKKLSLPGLLGWQDVKQRYRRSKVGPFWLTISMGIMIATIGIVFGSIFNSPMREFLPFLTIGMIFWTFISTTITESCTAFISAEGIIKQLPIPLFVHVLRMLWRNLIILAHNIVIVPLVFLVLARGIGPIALLSLLGVMLLIVNLSWAGLILGIVCARYRDLPQIINSFLQVAFYLTPIMWMPKTLPQRAGVYLLEFNPLFHTIETLRAPLLGVAPTLNNWLVTLACACVGWIVALMLFSRYKSRVAYWL